MKIFFFWHKVLLQDRVSSAQKRCKNITTGLLLFVRAEMWSLHSLNRGCFDERVRKASVVYILLLLIIKEMTEDKGGSRVDTLDQWLLHHRAFKRQSFPWNVNTSLKKWHKELQFFFTWQKGLEQSILSCFEFLLQPGGRMDEMTAWRPWIQWPHGNDLNELSPGCNSQDKTSQILWVSSFPAC